MNRQQSLIAKLLQQQHTKKYAEGGSAGARGRRDQVATDTGWDPSSMGQKLADVGKYTLNQVTTPLETVTGWEFYDPSFSETKFGSTTGKISKVNEGLTSIATDVAGTALLGPGYAAGKAALTAGFDAAGAKDVNSGQIARRGGPVKSYQNGTGVDKDQGMVVNAISSNPNHLGYLPKTDLEKQQSRLFDPNFVIDPNTGQPATGNKPNSNAPINTFLTQQQKNAGIVQGTGGFRPPGGTTDPRLSEEEKRMQITDANMPFGKGKEKRQRPNNTSNWGAALMGTDRNAGAIGNPNQAAGVVDAFGKLQGKTPTQVKAGEMYQDNVDSINRRGRDITVYGQEGTSAGVTGNEDPTAQMKLNALGTPGPDPFGKISQGLKMAGDIYASGASGYSGGAGPEWSKFLGGGEMGSLDADSIQKGIGMASKFFKKSGGHVTRYPDGDDVKKEERKETRTRRKEWKEQYPKRDYRSRSGDIMGMVGTPLLAAGIGGALHSSESGKGIYADDAIQPMTRATAPLLMSLFGVGKRFPGMNKGYHSDWRQAKKEYIETGQIPEVWPESGQFYNQPAYPDSDQPGRFSKWRSRQNLIPAVNEESIIPEPEQLNMGGGVGSSIGSFYGGVNAAFLDVRDKKHKSGGHSYKQGSNVEKEGTTILPMTPQGALDVPEGFQGYFPIPGGDESSHERGGIPMITPAEGQGKQEIEVEGGEGADVSNGETFIIPKGKMKRKYEKVKEKQSRIAKLLQENELQRDNKQKKFDDIELQTLEHKLNNAKIEENALREEIIANKKAKEAKELQQLQQGPGGQLFAGMMGQQGQQGMNPQMMDEGAEVKKLEEQGLVPSAAYLTTYAQGRRNTKDWYDRVNTGDLKPTNYYDGILQKSITYLQDALDKRLPASQRHMEANLQKQINAANQGVQENANSAGIMDARLRKNLAVGGDKMGGIGDVYGKLGLQYEDKIAGLIGEQDKIERTAQEKQLEAKRTDWGDYRTAMAEDIDELAPILSNLQKNRMQAAINERLAGEFGDSGGGTLPSTIDKNNLQNDEDNEEVGEEQEVIQEDDDGNVVEEETTETEFSKDENNNGIPDYLEMVGTDAVIQEEETPLTEEEIKERNALIDKEVFETRDEAARNTDWDEVSETTLLENQILEDQEMDRIEDKNKEITALEDQILEDRALQGGLTPTREEEILNKMQQEQDALLDDDGGETEEIMAELDKLIGNDEGLTDEQKKIKLERDNLLAAGVPEEDLPDHLKEENNPWLSGDIEMNPLEPMEIEGDEPILEKLPPSEVLDGLNEELEEENQVIEDAAVREYLSEEDENTLYESVDAEDTYVAFDAMEENIGRIDTRKTLPNGKKNDDYGKAIATPTSKATMQKHDSESSNIGGKPYKSKKPKAGIKHLFPELKGNEELMNSPQGELVRMMNLNTGWDPRVAIALEQGLIEKKDRGAYHRGDKNIEDIEGIDLTTVDPQKLLGIITDIYKGTYDKDADVDAKKDAKELPVQYPVFKERIKFMAKRLGLQVPKGVGDF